MDIHWVTFARWYRIFYIDIIHGLRTGKPTMDYPNHQTSRDYFNFLEYSGIDVTNVQLSRKIQDKWITPEGPKQTSMRQFLSAEAHIKATARRAQKGNCTRSSPLIFIFTLGSWSSGAGSRAESSGERERIDPFGGPAEVGQVARANQEIRSSARMTLKETGSLGVWSCLVASFPLLAAQQTPFIKGNFAALCRWLPLAAKQ